MMYFQQILIYDTVRYCTMYNVHIPRKEGNVQKLEARKGLHLYLSDICDDRFSLALFRVI